MNPAQNIHVIYAWEYSVFSVMNVIIVILLIIGNIVAFYAHSTHEWNVQKKSR